MMNGDDDQDFSDFTEIQLPSQELPQRKEHDIPKDFDPHNLEDENMMSVVELDPITTDMNPSIGRERFLSYFKEAQAQEMQKERYTNDSESSAKPNDQNILEATKDVESSHSPLHPMSQQKNSDQRHPITSKENDGEPLAVIDMNRTDQSELQNNVPFRRKPFKLPLRNKSQRTRSRPTTLETPHNQNHANDTDSPDTKVLRKISGRREVKYQPVLKQSDSQLSYEPNAAVEDTNHDVVVQSLSMNIQDSPGSNQGSQQSPVSSYPFQSSGKKSYTHAEWLQIERFWKAYDEFLILSLFSILGILFRLLSATWFAEFDNVFNEDSALFTNLPLNCFSCWLMGLLCPGTEALDIVYKRIGLDPSLLPTKKKNDSCENLTDEAALDTNKEIDSNAISAENDCKFPPLTMKISRKTMGEIDPSLSVEAVIGRDRKMLIHKAAQAEMREVQLLALERRIRASPSLVLFPAKKQDVDVIEHACEPSSQTYQGNKCARKILSDYALPSKKPMVYSKSFNPGEIESSKLPPMLGTAWKKFSSINIADGWDVGTTPDAMKDGILLGLRVGFCGSVSSFSSWNSDMVSLLRRGFVDSALVGYTLGLLLPIVSYRAGQHCAVFIFVFRCRQETKRDEKRGYGLRLNDIADDDDEEDLENAIDVMINGKPNTTKKKRAKKNGGRILDELAVTRNIPSIRAIVTAVAAITIVCFISALIFFTGNDTVEGVSWSLLFSPIGGLARRKLTADFNDYFPSFPVGSFICNILGCALSGGLGSLLAGDPGPGERLALVSMISGFAGSLSAFSTFLVEVLERVDPMLLNIDGISYAISTIFWALLIGLACSQTKDWADKIVRL